MQLWKQLRVVVLVVALGGLGWLLYLRGNPFGLGGQPASLETDYVTEEAWVVTEILQALTSLAGPAAHASSVTLPRTTAPGHLYDVDGRGLQVDLSAALWDPAAFVPVARFLSGSRAPASFPAPLDTYRMLATEPGPGPIVAAAALADARLRELVTDAAAHETAALANGAFALRESAGLYYSDVRSALSRMTAHLAMAGAARAGGEPSADGRLALALLWTLANHQARAAAVLEPLSTSGDDLLRAWTVALRLRLSEDWRLLPDPARATRVEQLQYFRARRAVLPGMSASEDLALLGHAGFDGADWLRIGRSFPKSVADAGDFTAGALAAELDELRRVRQAIGYPPTSGDAAAIALLDDETPPPGVAEPRVLPWSAWAAQVQRHLASYTAELDRYYRHRLGSGQAADQAKRDVDAMLGGLRLFPLGALGRTAGSNGGLGDFEYVREGIALAAGAPSTMQYAQWAYLAVASQYEPAAQRMPDWQPWFVPAAARMPYEAEQRAGGASRPDADTLAALAGEAPYDYAVAAAALQAAHGTTPPADAIERRFGGRLHYDVRALSWAAEHSRDDVRIAYQTRACDLAPRECVELGALFVAAEREAEAAHAYARAFADPGYDGVSLANMAPWLVDYYARTGRPDDALRLAERGAESGALVGLQVASRLYERLGRFDEAERAAERASRYDSSGDLFGFYYRAVHTHGRSAYAARLAALTAEVFPAGMHPAPTALAAPPSAGVFINRDSELSRRHGVQTGDIIVGAEGWRVDDQRQYRAASATALSSVLTLSVWRGAVSQVRVPTPSRLMGVEFRNHPMTGWTD